MVAFRSRVSIRGFDIRAGGHLSLLPRAVILRGATSLSQERGIPPPVAEPDSGVAATGPGDTPSAQAQHSGKRVAWGGIWSIAGFASRQVVRFGSNLLLTRFLDRQDYGLVAIVWPVVLGVHLFTDFGIGQSIIQNPRGEERAFRNTAWTIQAARGLGLWLVLVAIAPFVADFYDQPILAAMIAVAGLGIALGGLEATSLHVRSRNLDVRSVVSLELVSQLCGTGVRGRLGADPPDTVGPDRLDAGGAAHEDDRQPLDARDRRPVRMDTPRRRGRSSTSGSGSSSARC